MSKTGLLLSGSLRFLCSLCDLGLRVGALGLLIWLFIAAWLGWAPSEDEAEAEALHQWAPMSPAER
ncbi:hypothetical protein BSZ21_17375 [Bradyrhizobium canariense]|nr:hypothetical protein BSZ21_17375 [Bradyrhizobium canariense]